MVMCGITPCLNYKEALTTRGYNFKVENNIVISWNKLVLCMTVRESFQGVQATPGTLFFNICEIRKHKPKYLIMENVRIYPRTTTDTWNVISVK
jgi:site-specific DNA-cytosine methylase